MRCAAPSKAPAPPRVGISRTSAHCHHLSIELLCQRFDNTGTKSGFGLSEHAVRFAGTVVGDSKLPIGAGYVIGDLDRAVLCGVLEGVLEGIDDQFGDDQTDALGIAPGGSPAFPSNLIEISRLSLIIDFARAAQSVSR